MLAAFFTRRNFPQSPQKPKYKSKSDVAKEFRIFTTHEGFSQCAQAIRFYQELGFFEGQTPDEVIEEFFLSWRRAPSVEQWWDEAYLLGLERKQVWTADPEADVVPEGNVYPGVIHQWANISHGAFNPLRITEHWSEDCQASIEFTLNGQPVSLQPKYLDDWIDLDILEQINDLIKSSERQFNYVCIDNWCLVLCLTADQKRKMKQSRNFPFAL